MNFRPHHFSTFLVFSICALLLAGCASNRMISSWSDPNAGSIKGDVLVVTVTHWDTLRKLCEESYVKFLAGEDVKAVAGYTVIEGGKPASYEDVVSAVNKTGVRTLLVTQLSDIASQTSEQMATGRKYDTLDALEADPIFFQPVMKQTTKTTTRVRLVSRLFDVQSRKLLWSGTTESKDPVMTTKYIDKLTSLIVDDMKKKQLL